MVLCNRTSLILSVLLRLCLISPALIDFHISVLWEVVEELAPKAQTFMLSTPDYRYMENVLASGCWKQSRYSFDILLLLFM